MFGSSWIKPHCDVCGGDMGTHRQACNELHQRLQDANRQVKEFALANAALNLEIERLSHAVIELGAQLDFLRKVFPPEDKIWTLLDITDEEDAGDEETQSRN